MHARSRTGAAPHCTQGTVKFDPNRRPYTTERLRFTQNNTATQSFTRSSSCSKCATHDPASVFSLQSQITMSRRHSPNCDELQRPTATIHRTRTNELVHTFPTITANVPSGRFRLFLAQQSRRSLNSTNARSHNSSCGQPAPKPVDVFGPSAPRVRRRSCRSPSRRVEGTVVCAHRRTLPPAVSPLGRAPCSVALPSFAGSSSLRGVRGSVG